jgi:hypothetical protein
VYISQAAHELTSKERGAFIGGAIVETLFFLISSIGYVRGIHILTVATGQLPFCTYYSLIGVIVRKQTFVTAYAIGLYVHFLINFGVAGYLLFVILHTTNEGTDVLCHNAISSNSQAQGQCSTVFSAIRDIYAALASIILILELCESFPHISRTTLFIGLRCGNCRNALRLPSAWRET